MKNVMTASSEDKYGWRNIVKKIVVEDDIEYVLPDAQAKTQNVC